MYINCIELNRHYLRARYYNQYTGRMNSMDTWMGINNDPVTLHKYLYAYVDPVNMIDPSGNIGMIGGGGFGGALTSLSTIAVSNYTRFVISANLTAIRLSGALQFSALGVAGQKVLANSGHNGIRALQQGVSSMVQAGRTINVDQARSALNLTTSYGTKLNKILNFSKNPANIQYHHIVEQWQISRFGSNVIHSVSNIIPLTRTSHTAITRFYSSSGSIRMLGSQSLRSVLSRAPFEQQWRVGSEIAVKAMRGQSLSFNTLSVEAQQIIIGASRLPAL